MAKSKKKKPELHQYSFRIRTTNTEEVFVDAASPEEAEAKINAGEWEDAQHMEMTDWEIIGGPTRED